MTRRAHLGFCVVVCATVIGGEMAAVWRQHRTLALQEHSLEILERRTARLLTERLQLRRELHAVPAISPTPETGNAEAGSPAEAATVAWIARVHRLRSAFAAEPARRIPELECLTPAEWLELAQSDNEDDGDEARLRTILALIRGEAKFAFLQRMQEALVLYCAAHDGELPASVASLAVFFEIPPPAGALERYAMQRQGKLHAVGAREPILSEQALPDAWHDSRYSLAGAPSRLSVMPFVLISPPARDIDQAIERAQQTFAARHGGAAATTPEELAAFLPDDSVKLADVQAFWNSPLRKK